MEDKGGPLKQAGFAGYLKGFVARCAQALPIAYGLGRGNRARKRECLQTI